VTCRAGLPCNVMSKRVQAFLRVVKGCAGKVANRDVSWLRYCIATSKFDSGLVSERLRVGRTSASRLLPNRMLRRRRGLQGAPVKCSMLRDELFAWFVDIRASLATRISPRFVLLKARQIADVIVQEQVKSKAFVAMPKINAAWLMRWKKDKGIVFRKPNLRFKVSRPVLLARVKATWCNVLRVRYLAAALIGSDLADRCYGVDEKPIHFNESGSKAERIRAVSGCPAPLPALLTLFYFIFTLVVFCLREAGLTVF
jgi:hypothetical protein